MTKRLLVLATLVMVLSFALCFTAYASDPHEGKTHNYEFVSNTATCENAGELTEQCSICRDLKVTPVGALGHNFNKIIRDIKPDCVNNGVITRECARCLDTTDEIIEKLGHDFAEVVTPHTCKKDGFVTYTCRRCTETYTRANNDPATHHWDDGVVTEVTCLTDGYTIFTCTVCSETLKGNIVPKLGHNYVEYSRVSPTCTADGEITEKCSRCFDVRVVKGDNKLGHDWPDVPNTVVPSTCTVQGYELYDCTRCTAETKKMLPLAPHSWTLDRIIDPDCLNDGAELYHCTVCKDTTSIAIEQLGHDWDWNSGVITVKPLCETDGIITYPCTRCDAKSDEILPAICHDWELREELHVYEDCLNDGCDMYICKNCLSKKEIVIKAPGKHNWDDGNLIDPTCLKDGRMVYTCQNTWGPNDDPCGAIMAEVVKALGHDWVIEDKQDSTCMKEGFINYVCTRIDECEVGIKTEIIPKKDHTWTDGTLVDGHIIQTCINAYEIEGEVVFCNEQRVLHNFVTVPGVKATCTKEGLSDGSQCFCGEWGVAQTTLPKAAHDYKTTVINPTTTTTGYTLHSCRNCTDSYKDNYKAKLSSSPAPAADLFEEAYEYIEILTADGEKIEYKLSSEDDTVLVVTADTMGAKIIIKEELFDFMKSENLDVILFKLDDITFSYDVVQFTSSKPANVDNGWFVLNLNVFYVDTVYTVNTQVEYTTETAYVDVTEAFIAAAVSE